MPRKKNPPPYPSKPHPSGQARIVLNGRQIYLGKWGTPESHEAYARKIAEWRADPARPTGSVRLVADVLGAFWKMIESSGKYSQWERANFKRSLVPVIELYGMSLVRDFDALALKACRQRMIDDGGKSRRMVNARVGRIVRVWKWAASEKLIPLECWQELTTVAPLTAGECGTVDYTDVPPADPRDVDAALAELNPVVAAMVRIQLLTAARPGEVVALRPCDIIREGTVEIERGVSVDAGKVWITVLRANREPRPRSAPAPVGQGHKTAHRGHTRIILYGPRAQEILRPFLEGRPPDHWVFNPTEARREHHKERAKRCAGKPYPSRAKGVKVRNCRYRLDAYGRAILRACERANVKAVARLGGVEGKTCVHHWHPHQLRHAAASSIADEFGPELARIILGQRTLSALRTYLRDDHSRAAEVMNKRG